MDNSQTSFSNNLVSAWAVIDSTKEVQVLYARFDYVLNAIPTGIISLALGFALKDQTDAAANSMWDTLRVRIPVQVYVTLTADKAQDQTYCIFDGYVAGVSAERGTARAGLTLSLLGWLDDLRTTSAMSQLFSPSTPGSFISPASFKMSDGSLIANIDQAGLNYFQKIQTDLWDACKSAFIDITNKAIITGAGVQIAGGGGKQKAVYNGNKGAQYALKNLFTGKLTTTDANDVGIAQAMGLQMGHIIFGSEGGPTIWSKLITLASVFDFAIAPQVSKAAIIVYHPFVQAKQINKSLLASEVSDLTTDEQVQYSIRGFALVGNSSGKMTSGFDKKQRSSKPDTWANLEGVYESPLPGIWEIRPAPAWISAGNHGSDWTSATTGLNGEGVAGLGVQPVAKAGPGGNASVMAEKTALIAKGIGDRVAKACWLRAVYAARRVRVSGKLRFDVCPGSSVAVDFPGNSVSGVQSHKFYGSVDRVNIELDAGSATVRTVFDLSCVRGPSDDQYAVKEHPLYSGKFLDDALTTAKK